ncbi:hypothetical protein F4781DRAFT_313385 [Annulohypoxylon bovei var. microspora]|nr:hypothetical protein F4781DRAFT_313385 [Annulohypoxylon bovei var. microspora]
MDYMPCPSNPRYPHPDVPLLCKLDFKYPFKSVPHEQFPSHRGFELGPMPSLLGLDKILEDRTKIPGLFAMLQEWLLFGMLSEYLQQSLRAKDFAKVSRKSAPVVTMGNLAKLLEKYQKVAKKKQTREERSNHFSRMYDIFTSCIYVIEVVDIWARDHGDKSHAAFSLSVTCLGLVLELATHRLCNDIESNRPLRQWAQMHFTVRRLNQDGWCPYLIRALRLYLSPLEMYYASLMPPSPIEGAHHDNCTNDECVALDVDSETYKPRHLYKDCKCEVISIDTAEVQDILRRGGIPIIETWMDSEGKIQLQAVDSTKRRIYVAISHVWSDGLGNPHSNALPRCQLLKVQSTATAICEDLNGNIPFWLDTLAVPLERETRKLAISRMKETYAKAHKVLVLSNDFDMRIPNLSTLEFFMRLFCSAWMRRLWTLQEGVFAQNLAVWINKKAHSFEEMYAQFEKFLENEWLPIGLKLSIRWQNWRQLGNRRWELDQGTDVTPAKLRLLHGALRFRRTSKKEDEAICMASILNLNLSTIVSSKTAADRMAKMWEAIGVVPTGLIFTTGPRLEQEPFRWAPASMLDAGMPLSDNGQRGVIHEDGLHLQSPGWIVYREGDLVPQFSFHFRDDVEADRYFTIYSDKRAARDDQYDVDSTQYAILLIEPLEDLLQRPQLNYVAVKVSLQKTLERDEKKAVIRARFEERVDFVVVPPDEWDERRRQEGYDRAQKRNPSRYWEATRCSPEQSWILR